MHCLSPVESQHLLDGEELTDRELTALATRVALCVFTYCTELKSADVSQALDYFDLLAIKHGGRQDAGKKGGRFNAKSPYKNASTNQLNLKVESRKKAQLNPQITVSHSHFNDGDEDVLGGSVHVDEDRPDNFVCTTVTFASKVQKGAEGILGEEEKCEDVFGVDGEEDDDDCIIIEPPTPNGSSHLSAQTLQSMVRGESNDVGGVSEIMDEDGGLIHRSTRHRRDRTYSTSSSEDDDDVEEEEKEEVDQEMLELFGPDC